MSRRSRGRPSPSRGARVERRKALREQAADRPVVDGPREMAVPEAIRALDGGPGVPGENGDTWCCATCRALAEQASPLAAPNPSGGPGR